MWSYKYLEDGNWVKDQHISCLCDSVSRSCQQEFAGHINHNYQCFELLPMKYFQLGNFASCFIDNAFCFREKSMKKSYWCNISHLCVWIISQLLHMSLRQKKKESILENAINYIKKHFLQACTVMGFYCNPCWSRNMWCTLLKRKIPALPLNGTFMNYSKQFIQNRRLNILLF